MKPGKEAEGGLDLMVFRRMDMEEDQLHPFQPSREDHVERKDNEISIEEGSDQEDSGEVDGDEELGVA